MPGGASTIAIEEPSLIGRCLLTLLSSITQIPASFLSHVHSICCMLQIEFVIHGHTKMLCSLFIPKRLVDHHTRCVGAQTHVVSSPSQEHCVGFLEVYLKAGFAV